MRMYPKVFAAFSVTLLLAACSTGPSMPTSGKIKVGKPYQVKGRYYHPRHDPGYDQVGVASWYGPGFHGKHTANGEVYNQNDFTAAHPTLPMPSLVRVTSLVNGQSVVVRVNDRGPFAEGRIIDLSKAAAKKIGLDHMGIARVRVQYLQQETESYLAEYDPNYRQTLSKYSTASAPSSHTFTAAPTVQAAPWENVSTQELAPPPGRMALVSSAQASEGSFFVQVASFSIEENARRMADRVASLGNVQVEPVDIGAQVWYRVRLGPLFDRISAESLLGRVSSLGVSGARVIHH